VKKIVKKYHHSFLRSYFFNWKQRGLSAIAGLLCRRAVASESYR